MVSGDVFRAPKDALLLCVEVGSGVQIVSSATITLVFAALGALSLLPSAGVREGRLLRRCTTDPRARTPDGRTAVGVPQGSCRQPAAARC